MMVFIFFCTESSQIQLILDQNLTREMPERVPIFVDPLHLYYEYRCPLGKRILVENVWGCSFDDYPRAYSSLQRLLIRI